MDSLDEATIGLAGAALLVVATLATALTGEFTTIKPSCTWMITCGCSLVAWRLIVSRIGRKSRERRSQT
jgi:hypothetical protein